MGALHGFAGVLFFDGVGGALVKGHDDVGANLALHVHDGFRRKKVGASVDVRLEFDAFFADFAAVFEAVYLKSAAVGQHGAVPGRKSVQPASLLQHFGSGAQVEVVGVAQDDVGLDVVGEQVGPDGFDGALGSDGHKNRGRNRPVGGVEQPAARRRMGVFCVDFKLHGAKVRRGFLDYFCGV